MFTWFQFARILAKRCALYVSHFIDKRVRKSISSSPYTLNSGWKRTKSYDVILSLSMRLCVFRLTFWIFSANQQLTGKQKHHSVARESFIYLPIAVLHGHVNWTCVAFDTIANGIPTRLQTQLTSEQSATNKKKVKN